MDHKYYPNKLTNMYTYSNTVTLLPPYHCNFAWNSPGDTINRSATIDKSCVLHEMTACYVTKRSIFNRNLDVEITSVFQSAQVNNERAINLMLLDSREQP